MTLDQVAALETACDRHELTVDIQGVDEVKPVLEPDDLVSITVWDQNLAIYLGVHPKREVSGVVDYLIVLMDGGLLQ